MDHYVNVFITSCKKGTHKTRKLSLYNFYEPRDKK